MSKAVELQQFRAQWERRRSFLLFSSAVVMLGAIGGLVGLALAWGLSLGRSLTYTVLGALGWALPLRALEEVQARLHFADLPERLRARGALGGMLITILLLALSLAGLARIPGVIYPTVLGGLAAMFLMALRWFQEVGKRCHFVEVINDGRVFMLPHGQVLLEGLQEEGYSLIAQCGGAGRCATCRVRVYEARSQAQAQAQAWTPVQLGVLTPRQIQEGYVLSCQVLVEGDLVIELFKPLVERWPDRIRLSEQGRRIRMVLPGFDCEACGYFTCDEYAHAVASGRAEATRCLPGGASVRGRLQKILQDLKGCEVSTRA